MGCKADETAAGTVEVGDGACALAADEAGALAAGGADALAADAPDALATDATDAAIRFDDAAFTYDGETFVFEDLNLTVPRGQFLAIIGGNGSGKSTIARCIDALLRPDRGRVIVLGRPTDDEDALYEIRSSAGMVFQNPDDQIVASVIENDVAFGPENLGVPTEELSRRVSAALEAVGLAGFERHETHALSGGQKQRVAIAGVLAMEPQILILDEASAMLDPRGRKGLLEVCDRLHRDGLTIVMITHFMDEAALAERIVALEAGRVILDGPPRDVLENARRLEALNLEAPFPVRLSSALRDAGIAVPICLDETELAKRLVTLWKRTGQTRAAETASKRPATPPCAKGGKR